MTGIMLVTGGSRGIGAATARLAAARGYAVAVNYLRRRDAADAVVHDITGAGGRAFAVAADVASEADVMRMFEEVDGELGTLTALVNNAGILERQTRLENLDAARLGRVLSTNVTGAFRVNAVRPGPVYTDIHADGGEPDRVERIKERIPMGRGGRADEVAKAILWLLSDEASYSTGTFLDVAGGL